MPAASNFYTTKERTFLSSFRGPGISRGAVREDLIKHIDLAH
jgi:hypothetical protein